MPVERSPPKIEKEVLKVGCLAHANSDSSLNTSVNTIQPEPFLNVTKRHKRTFDVYNEIVGSKEGDIKTMLADLQASQDKKFDTLTTSINLLLIQNQDIKKSVETLSTQYEQLLNKSNFLETENCELKKRVTHLENQLDLCDKNVCKSTIEVRNIPKNDSENKQILSNIVKDVGHALGLKTAITDSEIRDIYRTKSEVIVVDFVHTSTKESLVSEYYKLRKLRRETKMHQFNTNDIKIDGTPRTIFISEALTKKTRHLFYLARQHVRNKTLVAAWCSFGKLFVKKLDESSPIHIVDEIGLLNITD